MWCRCRYRTEALAHRQRGADDVRTLEQENVADVDMIGGDVHAQQLDLAGVLLRIPSMGSRHGGARLFTGLAAASFNALRTHLQSNSDKSVLFHNFIWQCPPPCTHQMSMPQTCSRLPRIGR